MASGIEMKDGRVGWVDISRVLAMFFVVYMHTPQYLSPPYDSKWNGIILGPSFDALSPCTVVLMYFFLSGWLKTNKCRWLDWKSFLFILGPLCLWNIVTMVLDPSCWDWRWTLPLEIPFAWHQFNPPLWFLRDYAVLSLFFPLIMRMSVKFRGLVVLVGFMLVEFYGFNYQFYGVPQVITYFFLGTLVQSLFERRQVAAFVQKYAIVVSILAVLFTQRSVLGSWLPELPMTNKVAMYGLFGLLALLSYGAAVEKISTRVTRWCSAVAPAVFTIYVSHYPFILLIQKVTDWCGGQYLPEKLFPLYAVACYAVGLLVWFAVSRLPLGLAGEWITMQKRRVGSNRSGK